MSSRGQPTRDGVAGRAAKNTCFACHELKKKLGLFFYFAMPLHNFDSTFFKKRN
jgi:hypothetical protein